MIAFAVVACSTALIVLGVVVVVVLGRDSDSDSTVPADWGGAVSVAGDENDTQLTHRISSAVEAMLEVGWSTELSTTTAPVPQSGGATIANIANIAKAGGALEAMLEVGWTSDLRATTVPAPGVGLGAAGLAEVGFWG